MCGAEDLPTPTTVGAARLGRIAILSAFFGAATSLASASESGAPQVTEQGGHVLGVGPTLAVAALSTSGLRDVATDLAALAAPDPALRSAAERRLTAALRPVDLPTVAAALRGAAPAVADALVRVLGSEDRHFDLAALVAADLDPTVAAHGQAALRGHVARWSTALLAPPLDGDEVPSDLGQDPRERDLLITTDTRERRIAFTLERGGLADLVDRLDRLAGLPVPLVLDPPLHPGVRRVGGVPERPQATLRGAWFDLVRGLVGRQRLGVWLHGEAPYDLRRGDEPTREVDDARAEEALEVLRADEGALGGRSAPVLLVALPGRAAELPLVTRLVEWTTVVATPTGDPALREAAARALAASRWSTAVGWLARRWLANGDPAALEGTLAALARGAVEPVLVSPEVVRTLLREADTRLAANAQGSQRFAERVARALAALPAVDMHGAPLADAVLAGYGNADPVGRWARLVALEGQGRRHAGAAQLARAALADPGTPEPLLVEALAALRVLAAPSDAAPTIARPRALLAGAEAAGLLEETGRWLARSRAALTLGAADVVALEAAADEGAALSLAGPFALDAALVHLMAVHRADDAAAVTAWGPTLARTLADPVRRARFAALAREAHGSGLFPGDDPAAFVTLVRDAVGARDAITQPAFGAWLADAGLATATQRSALLAAARGRRDTAPAEALALAAGLVADPELGAEARELLRAVIVGRIDLDDPGARSDLPFPEVRRSLVRAARLLLAARLELEAEELFGAIRTRAGRGWRELASLLYGIDWPPPPEPRFRDVDALERRYGR